MRSLHLRVIVSFALALLVSVVTVVGIWIGAEATASQRNIADSLKIEVRQAQIAYETGGAIPLSRYLTELDAAFSGTHYLSDTTGRDLVSGDDRSNLRPSKSEYLTLLGVRRESVVIQPSLDHRYQMILVPSPPLSKPFSPLLLVVPAVIVLLAGSLSFGIISPILRVTQIVDRFGAGDLSARVPCDRKDEIGRLSRSFNSMADRIETLVAAERRLLQDVSHELRSPLTRLGLAVELMKSASNPEAALNRVRREIQRLSNLIGSLLDVVSAEGDPASRAFERISLVSMLDNVISDAAFEADSRGVAIRVQTLSSPEIEGDMELLRRAIENVLRNAIRFSQKHSDVFVEMDESAGNATISIRDSGPGVPEESLARIFNPFFRVEAARDRSTGGVGLGLSIARRAILLHHGSIFAENANPGLRVKIAIPAVSS